MYSRGHAVVVRQRFDREIARAVADAFDGDAPLVDRVRALWSLEGAHASDRVDGRALVSLLGGLLAHPSTLLAREAFEVLCSLALDEPFSSAQHALRAAELTIAAGVTKGGALAISPRSFQRCEPVGAHVAWCPDLDCEVVALVDVHRLQPRITAPLGLLAGFGASTTLVVAQGPGLRRVRREGRLGTDPLAPRARALSGGAGAFALVAGAGSSFVLDGVRAAEARVDAHHTLAWGDGEADVVVVPCARDHERVLVDVPDVGFDAVAVGDAWFSRLKLARGHIAFGPDHRALVVDRSGASPAVASLAPGEAVGFGAYDAELLDHGGVLRLVPRRADGPDRARPSVRQAVSAAKRAA